MVVIAIVVIAIVVIAIVVIAIVVPLDQVLHPRLRHNPRLRPEFGFLATNSFNVIL
jgi:hypothetical protein